MGTSRILIVALLLTLAILGFVYVVYQQRPQVESSRLTSQEVLASGKCIECHARQTGAITVQFLDSRHAQVGVTCLDCHTPLPGQDALKHHGFQVVHEVTAGNCQGCHNDQYQQMLRSRHGPPAWTAVMGSEPFKTAEGQWMAAAKPAVKFHPKTMGRGPNRLAILEGTAARSAGCQSCHAVGRPNRDGSIGDCSACHLRHEFSIQSARAAATCGRCHMGPDHAQMEIWNESTHGIVHADRANRFDLTVPSGKLTVKQQDAPSCSTCHMSGLNDLAATHDVGERLSLYLFAPISTPRPNAAHNRIAMQQVCGQCHASTHVERFYARADRAVEQTNAKIERAGKIIAGLRAEGLLTKTPFDEKIEFIGFNLWHHYGRTAKHGAFMNGADYTQWHGAYPIAQAEATLREMAADIRRRGGTAARLEEKKNEKKARGEGRPARRRPGEGG